MHGFNCSRNSYQNSPQFSNLLIHPAKKIVQKHTKAAISALMELGDKEFPDRDSLNALRINIKKLSELSTDFYSKLFEKYASSDTSSFYRFQVRINRLDARLDDVEFSDSIEKSLENEIVTKEIIQVINESMGKFIQLFTMFYPEQINQFLTKEVEEEKELLVLFDKLTKYFSKFLA